MAATFKHEWDIAYITRTSKTKKVNTMSCSHLCFAVEKTILSAHDSKRNREIYESNRENQIVTCYIMQSSAGALQFGVSSVLEAGMKKLSRVYVCVCVCAIMAGCSLDDPDNCPDDPRKDTPGLCGCGRVEETFTNNDGILVCNYCFGNQEANTHRDQCDCSNNHVLDDDDMDGVVNCLDACPNDPAKTAPGQCGCGNPETEGCGAIVDNCPDDPDKTEPGECGCGNPETEGCGVVDNCPDDPDKTEPGQCGCGNPEVAGCGNTVDNCPDDPDKTEPGECGCGNPEIEGCGIPVYDADGDGLEDSNDPCPTNPDTTLLSKDCKVVDELNRTATIRHAFDFYTLQESLAKDTAHEKPWKITIQSDSNLNFGYENMNGLAQKAEMTPDLITISSDGNCTVKSPSIVLLNATLAGNSNVIKAAYNDKSCALDNALFDLISTNRTTGNNDTGANAKVSALDVEFDVAGSGNAIFANEISGATTVSDIRVKGTLTTNAANNVGGLAGFIRDTAFMSTLYSPTINDCVVEDIRINAPDATNVGGLFGNVTAGTIYIKDALHVTSVVGKENVGGLIGHASSSDQVHVTLDSSNGNAITAVIGSVSGESYVGGFVGDLYRVSINSSISNRVTSVKGTGSGKYIGGYAGKFTAYYGSGTIANTANKVDSVEAPSSDYVGGLAGTMDSTYDHVLNEVGKVVGNNNVGGLAGNSGGMYGNISLKIVQSTVSHVEGNENVGGLFGTIGSDSSTKHSIYHTSSFANVYAKNTEKMGGLIGVVKTKSDKSTEIGWPSLITAASLHKADSDGTAIFSPMVTKTLIGNFPTNSMQYFGWYTTGNKQEKGVESCSDTNHMDSKDSLSSSQVTTRITNLNAVATGNYSDAKWTEAKFKLGDHYATLPILTINNMSLPE